jgi:hypothetical protein
MVKVKNPDQRKFATPEEYLLKIGEWVVETPLASVGLCIDDTGS